MSSVYAIGPDRGDEFEKECLLDSSPKVSFDEEQQHPPQDRKYHGHLLKLALFILGASLLAIYSIKIFYLTGHTQKVCRKDAFACQIRQAQAKFARMKEIQSKGLEEAMLTYGKRYGRAPPPGFDQWYQYAIDNNASFIDEYDGMEKDLEPFRIMPKGELANALWKAKDANQATGMHPYFLQQLNITNGKLTITQTANESDTNNDALAAQLIRPILPRLGNLSISILMNFFDEPRVLLSTSLEEEAVLIKDLSRKGTWDHIKAACPKDTIPGQDWMKDNALDVCSIKTKPSHGFFNGPDNFHPFISAVPLMSSAKVSNMGDILVPPSAYFNDFYRHAEVEDAMPFKEKAKQIYWRGSTTGIFMEKHKWLAGHRQRFVFLAKMISDRLRWIKWNTVQKMSSFSNVSFNQMTRKTSLSTEDLIDAAFTDIIHCEEDVCDDVKQHMPLAKHSSAKDFLKYQILADLDGEGMSGRFYYLLASNSAVLKQTIYREWHNNVVIPWVHFIPLSVEMDELETLSNWLLSTSQGQQHAAQIAAAGQECVRQVLRPIDATIYYYRLLLEYAAISN